jgi:tRNA modification GTPase
LVELHLPGNALLAKMALGEVIGLGARAAEAGEFTARAYFNGRMDLTEAEGVAAMVGAQSEQELRAARQLMAGELAKRLRPVMDLVAETLALVEVGIDFVDEEVTFISAEEVVKRSREAEALLGTLVEESARFERLSHEPVIVLVGRPNAGKSTLLNALAGEERAVVSPVAGTTRDVIWAEVVLGRGVVRVVDGAGIEGVGDRGEGLGEEGKISREMQLRARGAVEEADVVVLVREVGDQGAAVDVGREADLVLRTKVDLGSAGEGEMGVSARTGEGMGALREALDRVAFGQDGAGAGVALNARHLKLIEEARAALRRCGEAGGAEVVAMELREALDALGGVVGSVSVEDVLGRIFSRFCIGK